MSLHRHLVAGLFLAIPAVLGAAEPTVGFNGWTNVPGVREGTITVRPVDTTLPKPPLGYVDYLPAGYNPNDAAAKWPVLITLLGAGEAGNGTDTDANSHQLYNKMSVHGPIKLARYNNWDFPCIVIAPQTPNAWSSPNTIKQVVDYVKANYRVDANRLYMTGLCDGGSGTWLFAATFPNELAGMIPITAVNAPIVNATIDQPAAVRSIPAWAVHCFSDVGYPRRNTISWIDGANAAETGSPSNVMATYPGYNGNILRYACAVDAVTGKPASPNGPNWGVNNCTFTNGSKTVTLGSSVNSVLFGMWTGTDAKPFAVVRNGSTVLGNALGANGTTITLTQPWAGATGPQNINVQTPNGKTLTASYGGSAWNWVEGQHAAPGKRLLTMFWQYDHGVGWTDTWGNGECWDWLFSQAKNLPPTIAAIPAATVTSGSASAPIALTIGDAHSPASALTVSVASSDATLLPAGSLALSGSGVDRTLVISPAVGTAGSATLTVTVTDPGGLVASTSFGVTVQLPPNTAPTITGIAPQTLYAPTASPLEFSVGDAETAPAELSVSSLVSDPALIESAVTFSLGGGLHGLLITPASGAIGSATITVTVTDAGSLSTSTIVDVTLVEPPNTPPTISGGADLLLTAGTPSSSIAITVGDAESAASLLTVTATSSAHAIVPAAGLALGGAGASRTLVVTPASTAGTATIQLTVADPKGVIAQTSFVVTVTVPGDPEPTTSFNGWTNIAGVREGSIAVRPVDTTLPKPPLGYVEYLPLGYDPADATTKWPLVIALLGVGEAGNGTDTAANGHQLLTRLTSQGPLYQASAKNWDFPCIVISPQTANTWGSTLTIKSFYDYAKANYRVDASRIYMTGLVDGASGVLRFTATYPGELAGILPINASAAPLTGQAAAIKDVPTWAVHCFSDVVSPRRNSAGWIDGAAQAELSGTSNVLGNYPGYNGSTLRYACAVDAAGKPVDPAGPLVRNDGCTVTAGSKVVTLGSPVNSILFGLWSGTDAKPFARAWIGNDASPLNVLGSNATTSTLTANYAGASTGTQTVWFQTPVGLTLTAACATSAPTWTWAAGEAPAPGKRLITMFWQYDPSEAWTRTWRNATCWDWLFGQAKAPAGNG